jgi:hypothetical protein
MNCRLCQEIIPNSFAQSILLGRDVQYFDCPYCGYVQTEEPTWLEDAYSSPINSSDTGIMVRNLSNVSLVLATLALMGQRRSRVVDYAGGHGFLVRLLRDQGIDALWTDPYSENLVARGFEYTGEQASLVTAFEAFEHFVRPLEDLETLLSIAPNILLTTNIISTPAPQPSNWWYYSLKHGQHIGFYRLKTLKYMAKISHLNLLSDGASIHFFSQKKYSYLAWISLIELAKKVPHLLSLGLYSKTWEDYLMISKT